MNIEDVVPYMVVALWRGPSVGLEPGKRIGTIMPKRMLSIASQWLCVHWHDAPDEDDFVSAYQVEPVLPVSDDP